LDFKAEAKDPYLYPPNFYQSLYICVERILFEKIMFNCKKAGDLVLFSSSRNLFSFLNFKLFSFLNFKVSI